MFGSNKDAITPEQLDELLQPLIERVDKLETLLRAQAEQMAELQRQLGERQAEAAKAVAPTAEPQSAADVQQDYQLGDTIALDVEPAPVAETYYLPAPTPDGLFTEESRVLQVGKSIYRLRSTDGMNGYFEMLSSPDAIATATISVSQFVKPVCRIEGNTHRLPQRIETLEEGTAQREGNGWRVVRKATVKFD